MRGGGYWSWYWCTSPYGKEGNGICVATGATIPVEYIRAEGRAGRIGAHLMAVVAEGVRGRVYCEPSPADFNTCREAVKFAADTWGSLPEARPLGVRAWDSVCRTMVMRSGGSCLLIANSLP